MSANGKNMTFLFFPIYFCVYLWVLKTYAYEVS